MTKISSLLCIGITLLCTALLCACSSGDAQSDATISRSDVSSEVLQFTTPEDSDTVAVFETSYGTFTAVLYEDLAPMACENFIGLAESGFFDGSRFDALVSGSYIQAGLSAEGTASTIWNGNGFPIERTDALHHYAGALCAPLNDSGEASSPFYIVQALQGALSSDVIEAMTSAAYSEDVIATYTAAGGLPTLDYTDTVFGQIIDGMDVVDALAQSAMQDGENDTQEDASDEETGEQVLEAIIYTVTISTYGAL